MAKKQSRKAALEGQMSGVTNRTSSAGAKAIARGGIEQIERRLNKLGSRGRADLGGQFMGGDVRKWSEMSVRQQAEVIAKAEKASTAARTSDIGRGAAAVTRSPRKAAAGPRVKDMKAQAKAAGIKGASRMNKAKLLELRNAGAFSIASLVAAPAVAAAIAYDSKRSTALASGKGGTAATGDALKAAAGAGAGAAAVTGTVIGGMKLAAKAAPTVGRIASRAFLPLTAAMAAYEVGRGAVAGYAKGGVSGAIQGGAIGGADFLTFGGASYVANRKVRGEGQREAVSMASRGLKKADRKPRDPKSDGFVEGFTRRQNGKMVTVQTRKMTVKETARRFGA